MIKLIPHTTRNHLMKKHLKINPHLVRKVLCHNIM